MLTKGSRTVYPETATDANKQHFAFLKKLTQISSLTKVVHLVLVNSNS